MPVRREAVRLCHIYFDPDRICPVPGRPADGSGLYPKVYLYVYVVEVNKGMPFLWITPVNLTDSWAWENHKHSHRLCVRTGIHRATFAVLCGEAKLPRLRPPCLHRQPACNSRAYPQIRVDNLPWPCVAVQKILWLAAGGRGPSSAGAVRKCIGCNGNDGRTNAAWSNQPTRPWRSARSRKRAGSIASASSRSIGQGSPSSCEAISSAASQAQTKPREPKPKAP